MTNNNDLLNGKGFHNKANITTIKKQIDVTFSCTCYVNIMVRHNHYI